MLHYPDPIRSPDTCEGRRGPVRKNLSYYANTPENLELWQCVGARVGGHKPTLERLWRKYMYQKQPNNQK